MKNALHAVTAVLFLAAAPCGYCGSASEELLNLAGQGDLSLAFQKGAPVQAGASPAFAAQSSPVCCKDRAQCGRIKEEGLAALGPAAGDPAAYGPAVAAFQRLCQGRWYLTFEDGSALTDGSVGSMWITRKDLAGSYEFNVEAMSVANQWNADPAINIGKPGRTVKRLDKACFAPRMLTATAEGARFEISAASVTVLVQPSKNSGTDVPARREGYVVVTDYGRYLFSSDGR